MKVLEQVKEFMELMGQEVNEYPTIPSKDIVKLRHKLIEEENDEIVVGAADHDLVEVGDGLADSLYVLTGAIHAYGFGPIMPQLMDEVQRSNMTKVCKSREEAEESRAHYEDLETDNETSGVGSYYVVTQGEYFIVKRTKDGKVMKPLGYSPANLRPIIENYLATKPA